MQHWLLNEEMIPPLLTAGVQWQECEALWVLMHWKCTLSELLNLWCASKVFQLGVGDVFGCLCLETIWWSLNFLDFWKFRTSTVAVYISNYSSEDSKVCSVATVCYFWRLLNWKILNAETLPLWGIRFPMRRLFLHCYLPNIAMESLSSKSEFSRGIFQQMARWPQRKSSLWFPKFFFRSSILQ